MCAAPFLMALSFCRGYSHCLNYDYHCDFIFKFRVVVVVVVVVFPVSNTGNSEKKKSELSQLQLK